MIVILDANILLRSIETTSSQHAVAVAALSALKTQGDALRTVPQSFYEFWSVATRPIANNGLGFLPVEADPMISGFLMTFPLLDDQPGLFSEWRALVLSHACTGKIAHDVRYAAAMRTHSVTHFMTFNGGDFTRFPWLTIIDPIALAASPTS